MIERASGIAAPRLRLGEMANDRVTALGHEGPEWTVDEVVLLGAEERYEHTVLERVRLS